MKLSDPIAGTLQHVRLTDQALDYEALSYTWGDTSQKEAIILQNWTRKLFVGKNCHDALKRLRRKTTDRRLWIDAICINQGSLPERARQVRIMDFVYSRAVRVIVYLGEQVTESRALFQELKAVDKIIKVQGECYPSRPSDAVCQQLDKLFERPWFKRVWVLQEVSGKAAVTLMCGHVSVSFEALAALCFRHGTVASVTKKAWPVALQWISEPPTLFLSGDFNLWNRLYHSRRCLATDPKDNIFALMSLVGPEQERMHSIINYAQSTEECFTQVSTLFLCNLGLRMLTAIRHPHEMDMSSWIPDWSQDLPLDAVFFRHVPLKTV